MLFKAVIDEKPSPEELVELNHPKNASILVKWVTMKAIVDTMYLCIRSTAVRILCEVTVQLGITLYAITNK
jgi:hypothetical protein